MLATAIAETPVPETQGDEIKTILSAKDKAIADQQARITQLEESQNALLNRVAEAVEKIAPAPNGNAAPEVPEAPLPDNFKALPAEEQIVILATRTADKQAQKIVKDHLQSLMRVIGPVLQRSVANDETIQVDRLQKKFPKFDWAKHEKQVRKTIAGTPTLSLEEAVRIVAPVEELMPVTANIPFAETPRPSMSSATQAPGVRPKVNPVRESNERMQRLLHAAADANIKGQRVAAEPIMHELLKMKVRVPSSPDWGRNT